MDVFLQYLPAVLCGVFSIFNFFCALKSNRRFDWSKFFLAFRESFLTVKDSDSQEPVKTELSTLIASLDSIIKELRK
ncbi:hypothetical protein [Sigmofec virus UA08Rod_5397]|uniref:Uncharacterized protein n=1 Tax=Sigmofec virus UA08Rod_5397 TaxID=2929423 RepID=A0A976N1C2_9VIRU|nr:hypothetical protein [Sigmofec virus UA08Rod_5397]